MKLLLLAGAFAMLLGLAHSVLGEMYVLNSLLHRDDLPPLLGSDSYTKRIIRVAWHLTSIAWCGFGAMLVLWYFQTRSPAWTVALQTTAFVLLASGVLALVSSQGKHLSRVLFLLVGGIAAYLSVRG